jgi:hypothetical protein
MNPGSDTTIMDAVANSIRPFVEDDTAAYAAGRHVLLALRREFEGAESGVYFNAIDFIDAALRARAAQGAE